MLLYAFKFAPEQFREEEPAFVKAEHKLEKVDNLGIFRRHFFCEFERILILWA